MKDITHAYITPRCVARRVDPDVPAPDNPSPPLFLSATPASDPPPLANLRGGGHESCHTSNESCPTRK